LKLVSDQPVRLCCVVRHRGGTEQERCALVCGEVCVLCQLGWCRYPEYR
jgi:hypothetical protein